MTISTVTNSLAQMLDRATPNNIATFLQQLGLGRVLRQQVPATLRRAVPLVVAGYAYTPQTAVYTVALPDDAKAAYILRAQGLGAAAPNGELTFNAFGTANPATTTCNVSASGDLLFNSGTDAFTSVDVVYMPEKVDAVELFLTPVSSVVTIPSSYGTVILMEAEILTGTVVGKCVINKPVATAPGTSKQANLGLAKSTVLFNTGDAPTSVRIKIGVVSAIDQNALLEAAASVI